MAKAILVGLSDDEDSANLGGNLEETEMMRTGLYVGLSSKINEFLC